jgi:small-conductance mechanosensitive channel
MLAGMFSGSAFVASVLPVLYIGGLLVAGVAVSVLLRRVTRIVAFRRIHRYVPLLQLAVWLPIVVLLNTRLVPEIDGPRALGRTLMVLLLGIAALPWLRSVFLGVVFALEGRHRLGDDIEVGKVKGRLVGVGLRAVTVRAPDGTDAEIPYDRLVGETVLRLNLAARDTPCELEVEVPEELRPDRAAELARQAAALSRFASPRCTPEVFFMPRDGQVSTLRLRIRGYLFDREHEERYRSDLALRLHTAFAAALESDMRPAPWQG